MCMACALHACTQEGCFHDDLAAGARQTYHSCGQYNNVLASLLHALALSRLLCRTLILPGFFVRRGARLTRVSAFEEAWLPTSHFLHLPSLAAAFHVLELREWRGPSRRVRELPRLLARAEGGRPAATRFFAFHNVTFRETAPATFPHYMQQQSHLRWVSEDAARRGHFSPHVAGGGAAFWRRFGASEAAQAPVLAFDAPPSVGFGIDHLRWDAALRWVRAHVRYAPNVTEEAAAARRALFGDEPYLAVHIRRGADRLHDSEPRTRCLPIPVHSVLSAPLRSRRTVRAAGTTSAAPTGGSAASGGTSPPRCATRPRRRWRGRSAPHSARGA